MVELQAEASQIWAARKLAESRLRALADAKEGVIKTLVQTKNRPTNGADSKAQVTPSPRLFAPHLVMMLQSYSSDPRCGVYQYSPLVFNHIHKLELFWLQAPPVAPCRLRMLFPITRPALEAGFFWPHTTNGVQGDLHSPAITRAITGHWHARNNRWSQG